MPRPASPAAHRPSRAFGRYLRWLGQDISNLIAYGGKAPLACERIHLSPAKITSILSDPLPFSRLDTGLVATGDWDLRVQPFADQPKFQFCQRRWQQGQSWQQSGAIDFMQKLIRKQPGADDCFTADDIRQRYAALDALFTQAQTRRRLQTRQDINPAGFRESGGVFIHIDRHGQPLFGAGGFHRLSIAKILELDLIPAQIGVVHRDALDLWQKYRTPAKSRASLSDYLSTIRKRLRF